MSEKINIKKIQKDFEAAFKSYESKVKDVTTFINKLSEIGFDYTKTFGDSIALFHDFQKQIQQSPFKNKEDFILRTAQFLEDFKEYYKNSLSSYKELYGLGIDLSDLDNKDVDLITDFLVDTLIIDEETIFWWLFDSDSSHVDGSNIKVFCCQTKDGKEYEVNVLDAKDFLSHYYL